MRYQCFDPLLGKRIASDLLAIEAIKLRPKEPFTWASGWKSPIYCDNRLSLSFHEVRTYITDSFTRLITSKYADAQAIVGVATAGIPQGSLVAAKLKLPFLYVRSSSKSHGLTNMIEGRVVKGQKVVVLEDLISTGGSALAAVDVLRDAGIDVLGMTSIFNYGFEVAQKNFEQKNVDLIYLSEYSLLIEQAIEQGSVKQELKTTLDVWRLDPANWKP